MLSKSEVAVWPNSRRRIDDALKRQLGNFHAHVLRSVIIDLVHHGLPGLRKPIKFRFIDPIYAWIDCAYKLGQTEELMFSYQPVYAPSGHRLYGGSVAQGDIMRKACERLKYGSPALFGLSFDSGNASKRRSYSPILISVGNTDYAGRNSCICIGYLPILDLGDNNPNPQDKLAATHQLRQACVKAIVRVIEDVAVKGFMCKLPQKGTDGKYVIHICIMMSAWYIHTPCTSCVGVAMSSGYSSHFLLEWSSTPRRGRNSSAYHVSARVV